MNNKIFWAGKFDIQSYKLILAVYIRADDLWSDK